MIRLAVTLDRNRVVGAFDGGDDHPPPPHPPTFPPVAMPPGLPAVLDRLYESENAAVGAGSLMARLAAHRYRTVYVLTRTRAYHPPPGVESVVPVRDFMDLVHRYSDSDDELVVVGGPTVWRLFTPYARRIDVAETAEAVAGDVVYDDFEDGEFALVSEEPWEGGRTLHYERVHLTAEPHPTP